MTSSEYRPNISISQKDTVQDAGQRQDLSQQSSLLLSSHLLNIQVSKVYRERLPGRIGFGLSAEPTSSPAFRLLSLGLTSFRYTLSSGPGDAGLS